MSVFTADKLTSWQASQVTSYVHEYTCHKVSRQHFLQFWMDSLGSVCQECIIHLADDSERPIFLFWECSFVCLFVAVLVWVLVVLLFCGGFGWLGVGGDSLDYIYIKNVSGKQVTSSHCSDAKRGHFLLIRRMTQFPDWSYLETLVTSNFGLNVVHVMTSRSIHTPEWVQKEQKMNV